MKKWIRWTIFAMLAIAVVAGVALSMRPKPLLVDTVEAQVGEMHVAIAGEGRTRVKDRYVVTASVHGNLGRLELNAGDPVEEGTVLARVEPTAPPLLDARQRDELQARARAAEAAARQASSTVSRSETAKKFAARDLGRAKELFKAGSLSRSDLDTAQLAADSSTKDLESARFGARVAKYERQMAKAAAARARDPKNQGDDHQLEVTSPIAGKVLRILRESEGVVRPGEALLELADPAALEIVVDVLTAEAVEISPGDPVQIDRWGGTDPLKGRVRLVEPAAFTKVSALGVEEQRVNVVVDLDDAPQTWERLGDGFRVEVSITVWRAESTLKVPVSSLFREGDDWAVFVVEDGLATVRTVDLGRRNDFEVQVESGLEQAQEVIVHPSDTIADGTMVAPR